MTTTLKRRDHWRAKYRREKEDHRRTMNRLVMSQERCEGLFEKQWEMLGIIAKLRGIKVGTEAGPKPKGKRK